MRTLKNEDLKYDKFIIYESYQEGNHLIGYYRKLPMNKEVPKFLE